VVRTRWLYHLFGIDTVAHTLLLDRCALYFYTSEQHLISHLASRAEIISPRSTRRLLARSLV